MVKEILSDKIEDADDIRELGLEVLADLSNEDKSEYAKIKRKITNTSSKAVIGLSPIDDRSYNENISRNLSALLKSPVLTFEEITNLEDKKDLTSYGQGENYLIIDEKSLTNSHVFDLAYLEDYKIVVAKKSTHKKDLLSQMNELKRLGIKVLGVVYYK